jgi:enoyl-CoA hydratase
MTTGMLLTARSGDVLRLTINRPDKRNALSLELLDRIGAAFADHAADATLKCMVLTASGDRCFAAGGDLRELEAVRSEADTLAMSRRARAALEQIRRFPVPVVASLNGHALGGGAELAMACDMRIATAKTELGFLQAQLNVTTAWGGGIDLLAALGSARALQVLLEARRIPAAEALQLGLLQRVCAADESLDDCVAGFIAPFLQRPVQVLRAFKALALANRRTLHERLASQEEQGFTDTWIHADHWAAAEKALAPR